MGAKLLAMRVQQDQCSHLALVRVENENDFLVHDPHDVLALALAVLGL